MYPVTAINILKARGKSARESRQAQTHICLFVEYCDSAHDQPMHTGAITRVS